MTQLPKPPEAEFLVRFIGQAALEAATVCHRLERAGIPPEAFRSIPDARRMLNEMIWIGMALNKEVVTQAALVHHAESQFKTFAMQQPKLGLDAARITKRTVSFQQFVSGCKELYDSEIRQVVVEEASNDATPPAPTSSTIIIPS